VIALSGQGGLTARAAATGVITLVGVANIGPSGTGVITISGVVGSGASGTSGAVGVITLTGQVVGKAQGGGLGQIVLTGQVGVKGAAGATGQITLVGVAGAAGQLGGAVGILVLSGSALAINADFPLQMDPDRVLVILVELRVMEVQAENRTFVVPLEPELMTEERVAPILSVPADDRVLTA
jgi:hypothetical protein